MDLEIITESNRSPFRHVFPSETSNGRRYGRNDNQIDLVLTNLLNFLGIERNIRSLEIGAGNGAEVSKSLYRLGVDATTLDLDYTKIMKSDGKLPVGNDLRYPTLIKEDKIHIYQGDVANINHEKSSLKDQKYGLVIFWGSVHTGGSNAALDFGVSKLLTGEVFSIEELLCAPIQNVGAGGYIVYVSGYFNSHGDPQLYASLAKFRNYNMLDSLLSWVHYVERAPKKAIIFALSKNFLLDYLRENPEEFRKDRYFHEALFDTVDDLIIMSMEERERTLMRTSGRIDYFSLEQAIAINNLGLIDAVALHY